MLCLIRIPLRLSRSKQWRIWWNRFTKKAAKGIPSLQLSLLLWLLLSLLVVAKDIASVGGCIAEQRSWILGSSKYYRYVEFYRTRSGSTYKIIRTLIRLSTLLLILWLLLLVPEQGIVPKERRLLIWLILLRLRVAKCSKRCIVRLGGVTLSAEYRRLEGRGSYRIKVRKNKGLKSSHTECTKRRGTIGRLCISEGTQIL